MELEYKFYIPPEKSVESILRDALWDLWEHEAWRCSRHRAKYYTEAGGRLAEARISLRVRREDESYILTVKRPQTSSGSLSLRYEWNFPYSDKTPEAAEIAALLAAEDDAEAARTAEFFRSFPPGCFYSDMSTAIIRCESLVHFPDCSALVSIDEGVLRGGCLEENCRELEIELADGAPEGLDRPAALIEEYFGLREGTSHKLARCLALRERSKHLPDKVGRSAAEEQAGRADTAGDAG